MATLHTFKKEQKIPATISEVWDFISSPKNLKEITPSYMGFDIISEEDTSVIYQGMFISYIVKPIFKIPMKWTTEITTVKEHEYFVDEQRFGPYSMWHHKHFIKAIEGGVLMTDLIHYKLPLGKIGNIGSPFVKSQLNEIFDFRFEAMERKFGAFSQ
jgi:ligand-binding SRPBCC domain-containing protein